MIDKAPIGAILNLDIDGLLGGARKAERAMDDLEQAAEEKSAYLIMEGEYSSQSPVAVYSTREAAEQALAQLFVSGCADHPNIQEIEIDPAIPDFPRDRQFWEVTFKWSGSVNVERKMTMYASVADQFRRVNWANQRVDYVVCCFAPDKESAIKIAGERKAQYIAEREGIA